MNCITLVYIHPIVWYLYRLNRKKNIILKMNVKWKLKIVFCNCKNKIKRSTICSTEALFSYFSTDVFCYLPTRWKSGIINIVNVFCKKSTLHKRDPMFLRFFMTSVDLYLCTGRSLSFNGHWSIWWSHWQPCIDFFLM